MMQRMILSVLGAALAASAMPAAMAQTPGFHLVGMPPGFQNSGVAALSQDGSVAAGSSFRMSGSSFEHPGFTWTAASGRHDFGLEPGMPPATPVGGMNSTGSVAVGTMSLHSLTLARAYRRVGGGPLEDLGVLSGYERSYTGAVSGDGQSVAGKNEYSEFTEAYGQAFRWTPQTGMQGLGFLHPGDVYSDAQGISRDGSTIVGSSMGGGPGRQAFIWRKATGMQALPDLPGAPFVATQAHAVNADGSVVVGRSTNSEGRSRMVRWTAAGIEDLGTLSGGVSGIAFAVNDDGSVVGGMIGVFPTPVATVWTPATGVLALVDYLGMHGISTPAGWRLEYIYAISGDGLTFAGEARSPLGVREGFGATVPAPSALVILLSSAVLMNHRRRAHR